MGATVQMYVCVVKVGGGHQWIKQWPKDEHLIGLGRIDGWLHWTNGEMAQAGVECGKVVCVCAQQGSVQLPWFIYVNSFTQIQVVTAQHIQREFFRAQRKDFQILPCFLFRNLKI